MSWYSDKEGRTNPEQLEYFYQWFFKDVKGKILDIGCSTGNFASINPKKIIGIDVDKDAIKKAKEKGLEVQLMSIQKRLNFADNSFGGIYCSHVIEHLQEPLFALREMRRVLGKGGKLALMTPDIKKYGFRFWDLHDHVHPFTEKSLEGIAYDAGFRDFSVYHTYIPFRGQGLLVRKKIVSIHKVVGMHKALQKLGISGDNLVLEAFK